MQGKQGARSMVKQIVIVVTAFAILASTTSAPAQQAGKIYRIGYMGPDSVNPAFSQALSELGYVEGKNLTIEFRQGWATLGGGLDTSHAKELVARKVDLILSVGTSATRAAKQATNTIPIVMGNSGADPVHQGLIDSLAQPGGNVTGVLDLLSETAGKRVELLKEIFPKLSRIAQFSTPMTLDSQAHLKEVQTTARALGVQVHSLTMDGTDDLLERPIRAAVKRGVEAGIIVEVGFLAAFRKEIIDLAARYRLPTMHTHQGWVPLGGLISYTTDASARYRQAAWYVDKIFKGAKPAELPVAQPTKYVLEVNLQTARTLGITIPPCDECDRITCPCTTSRKGWCR